MHLLVKGTRQPLAGEVLVPNSKYHAHRALILASLAEGTSVICGLTDARHVQYTVQLLRGLGVRVDVDGDSFVVHGGPYRPRRASVSAGSSGSTLYFMIGLASLAERPVAVTGQKYFKRRPVSPLLDALRTLGVELESADGCPPVHVRNKRPTGGHVRVAGTLSQWISGLLLLAPFATGPSVVEVEGELNEQPYLELTVAMMRQFGLAVTVSQDWRRFEIEGGQHATPCDLTLPPDIGSAAFGLAAAALHPSDVLLRGMHTLHGGPADHPEAHFLDLARAMGVPLELDEAGRGVRVRHDGIDLKGVEVDCREVPDMLPVLATLGTFAQGESVFHHVAHTRLKESDRAAAMLQLNAMGGELELQGETLRVSGGTRRLVGTGLSSFNDHRVLMSLAVAASRASGRTTLTYPHAYRISYPAFLESMNTLGIPMTVEGGTRPSAESGGGPGADRRPRDPRTPRAPRTPVDVSRPDEAARHTLPALVTDRAARDPDGTALVDVRESGATTLTWRQLHERSEHIAALLLRLGVQPGEAVAFQLPNRWEFTALALACLRVRALCCPIMPIFREREAAFTLRRSSARVLLLPDHFRGRRHAAEIAALVAEGSTDVGRLAHVVVLPSGEGPAALPAAAREGGSVRWHEWSAALDATPVDPEAPAARVPTPNDLTQLLFTSGTTGEPKGVLQRSASLSRAVAMEIRHLGLTGADTIWIPSPLAHQTGFLYGMWLALVLGVPQIVQAEWNAPLALRSLREHRATFVQAATPFLMDLVRAVEDGERAPQDLRIFVATGATVPRGLAERASRVLGTTVLGAFGSTETCLASLAGPGDEPAQRWGTDGRALTGVRLRVTDESGAELPCGTEGHYEILTPTLFDGYLERPDLTAEALTADGWYRTGDLATIDASGFLRITGRVKDVINRGGEKIPVAEIEQLLHDHPAVADVAVVAMPDERLGERACAFVVPEPGGAPLGFEQMQKYLDSHQVAKQYWPERLETVADALPRNDVGKIQKFVLRERARGLRPQRGEGEGK
ncbi:3-phosphoshikimate 1-carboxyvinyltransferase [Streptomyces diacarni]|uniref:3-phosphoshikimate 1-carboxyvinyltransferase n=1 Tax=Streptomyces diacarni TaxID=2800381 RepID=A0A367ETJ8_9ACTN|nr:3-phosphoshikimate 1-carboxyvinyltransferase [Streptomyces diacarni]RCG21448.1 3-phosphoshikimate 1-carboxyvinyltransferase [Streptomyces diacarni]